MTKSYALAYSRWVSVGAGIAVSGRAWLARRGVPVLANPKVEYRGVDRLPYIPTLEEVAVMGLRGEQSLISLWDDYFDLEIDDSKGTSLDSWLEMRARFLSVAYAVELIWAGGAPPTDSREKPRWAFAGWDVSPPIPSFLSLLLQPAGRRWHSFIVRHLNDHGLLDSKRAADWLQREANRAGVHGGGFASIEVWLAEA